MGLLTPKRAGGRAKFENRRQRSFSPSFRRHRMLAHRHMQSRAGKVAPAPQKERKKGAQKKIRKSLK